MSNGVAVSDWLRPLAFFAVCGGVGYCLARLYVAALVSVGRTNRIVKFSVGTLLWLSFSVLYLMPLFVFPQLTLRTWPPSVMYVIWVVFWYGLFMGIPVWHAINRRIHDLRAVGWFLVTPNHRLQATRMKPRAPEPERC